MKGVCVGGGGALARWLGRRLARGQPDEWVGDAIGDGWIFEYSVVN